MLDPGTFPGQLDQNGGKSSQNSPWQHFSFRAVIVGTLVGSIICLTNVYFGLRAGLVNTMTMPTVLMSFAIFKGLGNQLDAPFTPQENALIQTLAGALAGMPMTAGFTGLIPALEYLTVPSEHGPFVFSVGKLYIWALGICLTGLIFAVLLRNYFIVREKLRFPSATATAALIGLLHDDEIITKNIRDDRASSSSNRPSILLTSEASHDVLVSMNGNGEGSVVLRYLQWKKNMRRLVTSFSLSGLFTFVGYFIPILEKIPIFGLTAARKWMWALSLSPAFISYGMIMETATVCHMVVGSGLGWGVLSPIAKNRGWAPGDVDDWESGSRGWTIWVSLGLILGDSVVGICWIIIQPFLGMVKQYSSSKGFRFATPFHTFNYTTLSRSETEPFPTIFNHPRTDLEESDDEQEISDEHEYRELGDVTSPNTPSERFISKPAILCWLLGSLVLSMTSAWLVYGSMVPSYTIILAVLLVFPLSIVSLRALGETDVAPVESISKLCQFLFVWVIPRSNPSAMLASMAITGVVEGGTCQSADLMPDFKTGKLVDVSPQAQFFYQIMGSIIGVFVSGTAYKVFTSIYSVQNGELQAPLAHLWIVTARLAYGKGLPDHSAKFALAAAVISGTFAVLRLCTTGKWWRNFIPGGVAMAIGMYLLPSITLAQAIGSAVKYYSYTRLQAEEFSVISVASGLILGEGVFGIFTMAMYGLGVPHLE